jgi:hypothetical protein
MPMTSRNRPAVIPALEPAETADGDETRVATLRVGAALLKVFVCG